MARKNKKIGITGNGITSVIYGYKKYFIIFKNLLFHNFIGFFSYFQEVKAVYKS